MMFRSSPPTFTPRCFLPFFPACQILPWCKAEEGACWFFQGGMLPTKPVFEEVKPSTLLLALSLYLLLHQKNDRRPPQ
jgi:hypothetical protein